MNSTEMQLRPRDADVQMLWVYLIALWEFLPIGGSVLARRFQRMNAQIFPAGASAGARISLR